MAEGSYRKLPPKARELLNEYHLGESIQTKYEPVAHIVSGGLGVLLDIGYNRLEAFSAIIWCILDNVFDIIAALEKLTPRLQEVLRQNFSLALAHRIELEMD